MPSRGARAIVLPGEDKWKRLLHGKVLNMGGKSMHNRINE